MDGHRGWMLAAAGRRKRLHAVTQRRVSSPVAAFRQRVSVGSSECRHIVSRGKDMKKGFVIGFGQDMAASVAAAREAGLDGVELMYLEPTTATFADVADRKRILEESGLELAAVGLWRVGFGDPAESGHADVIKAGLDFAAELGASCFYTGTGEPASNDKVGVLAECYPEWEQRAADAGMDLAVYLGHAGSYLFSEVALAETVARIPSIGLKLDPSGIIRNLRAEPLYVLSKFGGNLAHFHVKGLLRLADRELEPPPGLDGLPWAPMFGILHEHGYDGWVMAEPHSPLWCRPDHWALYAKLTFQCLGPYMA